MLVVLYGKHTVTSEVQEARNLAMVHVVVIGASADPVGEMYIS